MVAWRSASGQVAVFDAYCEHLGAHLGFGGHVEGENLVCPFHGWEWNREGRNVCIPYEKHPNRGRRIRSYPVVERNQAVWIWHDVERREPYFDVPDIFADFDDDKTADDYYTVIPGAGSTLFRERLELHPQYLMENGVDVEHFTYVHQTPFVPDFTRQDFSGPVSYVDFTVAFDDTAAEGEISSGVEAINGGLGAAVTKSWGMVDNRTLSAVTPVDERTSDVRFTVWIGRRPGDGPEMNKYATTMAGFIIEQFDKDLNIWAHQRYSNPPALSPKEFDGFMALRTWAAQFYPTTVPGVTHP
jgi:phenylpropionate dioxygenase-like ring-hydroxylating dioxygenase large terminal subunit